MISPLNPNHGLVAVSLIEEQLNAVNCTKITHGMKHTCLWRAPNGRHFHAPNPNVYSKVPVDTLSAVIKRLHVVMSLPPPPTAKK